MSSFVETMAMSVLKESPVEFVKYPLILAQKKYFQCHKAPLCYKSNNIIISFYHFIRFSR